MAGSTTTASDHADGDHAEGEHEHRSRWPLIAAVGAGALYLGAGFSFVGIDLVPALIPIGLAGVGAIGLLSGLFGWAYAAFCAGHGDSHGSDIYTTTMVLFLVSDLSTFSAGFIYYAFIRAGAWPPDHLPPLLGSLVAINTALLVASSVTIHYGHHALEAGDRKRYLGLMGATLGLGIIFLGGQLLEYYELLVVDGFSLSDGVLGSAFYGLTGLHGLHVSMGAVLLGIVFVRAYYGQYSAERHTSVSTASMYWHFVDVVWIFLVVVLYVGANVV